MIYLIIVTAILAVFISEGNTICPVSCYCRDIPNEITIESVITHVTCANITFLNELPATTNSLTLTSLNSINPQVILNDLTNISQSLPNFSELKLSGCMLENLDEISFDGLEECLQSLDLSHNLITDLPKSDNVIYYSNLTKLITLDLSCNRIQLINDDCLLSDFINLKTLNLSGNRLFNISSNGFVGLQHLEYLDLSSNNLSAIGGSVFSQLTKLQYLNLSNNKIETLEGDCFSQLTRLQQLDVSRNQLTSVEPSALQALPSLARLTLAGNPHLGDLLVGTGRRLQAVDASRTGLAHVPPALTRSVRTLRLAGNAIHTVRCGDLDSYPLLQLLDFAANGLDSIEDDALGRLDTLFMLYLSENNLRIVPKSLPTSLKILHLERNKIEHLKLGQFSDLVNLEVLLLSDNVINTLEEGVFDDLTSLVTLDISGNPLIALGGGALHGPAHLQVLRLAGLPVATAARDTAFPVHAPERLVSLDLTASPGLARMLLADAAALSAAKYLQELSLADAGLVHIRNDLLQFLPQLRSLRLTGNRLDCSGLLWLARWMRQQNREDDRAILCAAPPNLAGTLLIDLQDDDILSEMSIQTTSTSTTVSNDIETTDVDTKFVIDIINNTTTIRSEILNSTVEEGMSVINITTMQTPTEYTEQTQEVLDNVTLLPTINNQTITQLSRNTINVTKEKIDEETKKKHIITPQKIVLQKLLNQSAHHHVNISKIYSRKNITTNLIENDKMNTTIMFKYMSRPLMNENTSAKILRDLFTIPEPTTIETKAVKLKGGIINDTVNYVNEPTGSRVGIVRIIKTTTTTHNPVSSRTSPGDIFHNNDAGTTSRLKSSSSATSSEAKFILSPVVDIKTSSISHHQAVTADEDGNSPGGTLPLHDDVVKENFSHPGMVVLIAGVLGVTILVLVVTRWDYCHRRHRRRHIPVEQHDIGGVAGIEQQFDNIEVNHLPGVTDLW